MPYAAPKPCSHPGCRALVRGRGPCPEHKRKRERERGSAHQRGYDSRWRRYRLGFLARHPLCVECEQGGRVEPATVVDHKKDHKGDQALFWDESNHQALCKRCHDKRVDAGDFGR